MSIWESTKQVGVDVQTTLRFDVTPPESIMISTGSSHFMSQTSSVPQTTLGFLLPNGYYGGVCHSPTPDRAGSIM